MSWYPVLYTIVWPFFNLFHPCRAIGREHIPEGGAVICANHTRANDPFFVVFAFRRKHPLNIMAKAELMRIPVLGPLLKKVGVFGVDRGKSDVAAIKHALRCLKNGEKLLLFPEGTRVREGDAVAAKTGASMLALRAGVPLVPVWLPPKRRWFRPTPVVIGEPFLPEIAGRRPTAEDYDRITQELMERIHALEEREKG
jgi:1-acyl-sn-glycerol-3-phosphate acyltransferase